MVNAQDMDYWGTRYICSIIILANPHSVQGWELENALSVIVEAREAIQLAGFDTRYRIDASDIRHEALSFCPFPPHSVVCFSSPEGGDTVIITGKLFCQHSRSCRRD